MATKLALITVLKFGKFIQGPAQTSEPDKKYLYCSQFKNDSHIS